VADISEEKPGAAATEVNVEQNDEVTVDRKLSDHTDA